MTEAERMWEDATEQRDRYWARYWSELESVLADRRSRGLAVKPGPYQGPVNYSKHEQA